MASKAKDALIINECRIPLSRLAQTIPNLHFLHFYDAAAVEEGNAVMALDLGVTSLLGAPIGRGKALSELFCQNKQKWSDIDMRLAHVSSSWCLTDSAALGYKARVEALLTACCAVNGIGAAIATKLLHKKRPHLIPVIDAILLSFYGYQNKPHDAAELIFGPFRNDVCVNAEGVAQLQAIIKGVQGVPKLSDVRIVELAIWLLSDAAQGYRIHI